MKISRFLSLVFLAWLLISSQLHAEGVSDKKAPPLPEIHLLVDVSGSMKKTDPLNLRTKAVKMFLFLVKQKALMNIQVFAVNTKEIIPLKQVNSEYLKLLARNTKLITSDGAWTDIDGALNQANTSWGKGKRIIILMTDGAVDLGSESLTASSIKNINEKTIPKLQQDKVSVYSIGFSPGADKVLLDSISLKTNGLSQTVKTAKDIDTVLYSIFTAIIQVNGTPISKNQDTTRSINIDPSIHELTLIFKKSLGIDDLFLTDPKNKKSSVPQIANKDISTENYTFIDIDFPTPGQWILSGPAQEIERAIILTNVKLVSNFASGTYFVGEDLSLKSSLRDDKSKITIPAVLEQMKMSIRAQSEAHQYTYQIPYDDDGDFKLKWHVDVPQGNYRLTLTASSKFLSRELQYMVDIQPIPYAGHVSTTNKFVVELTQADLIKAHSTLVKATIKRVPFPLEVLEYSNSWEVDLFNLCSNPSIIDSAVVTIESQTVTSRELKFKLPIPSNACASINNLYVSQLPVIDLKPFQKKAPPKVIIKKQIKPEEKHEIPSNFNFVVLGVILLMITIIILILFVFMLSARYSKKINAIREQLKQENE